MQLKDFFAYFEISYLYRTLRKNIRRISKLIVNTQKVTKKIFSFYFIKWNVPSSLNSSTILKMMRTIREFIVYEIFALTFFYFSYKRQGKQ